ncbi:FkbM family methyltransferase [Sulfurimonas sp.]|uniref:FkbM family methyltransferase n=1 Tax=Sulfurimonas sp. TaxID=2022749 RepID=UPI002AB13954|nr:FkbM family methyltransferase [Sulfurimonas sp.]
MFNLVDFNYINEEDKKLTELFLSSSTPKKKYILGINKLTKSILKHIKVDGIIDDFTRVQSSRKKEILKIEDVPKGAVILSVSTGSPLEVKSKLDAMGFLNFNYLSFFRYSNLPLVPPPFMLDFKEDFLKNKKRYEDMYNLLEDEKSKEVFTKVINFKISFDLEFMNGFTNDHEGQYFDKEIVPDIKNITFVDGGGYVGDTAARVIKNHSDFKKIYLIEPISENLAIASRDLAEFKNIEFIPLGLSNKKTTLHFNEEKSFSSIYGNGTQSVEVDKLDNIIKEKVDFIKLDIEGAEQDAIQGAKKTIKKYKPVLAICIYHKAQDWYKIPQMLLEMNSDYKVYLRHYMEGIFESVLYFIPKKENKYV